MRAMSGVSKNRHGVYYVRKKVPKWLEQATAEVLGNGKSRQVFLKRSLDTKDLREANIRAKPVLMEFDRVLAQAEAPRFSPSIFTGTMIVTKNLLMRGARNRPVVEQIPRRPRETIEPGISGWLVPPRNPARLAAAIGEALSLGESERAAFSRRAIAHVASRYSRQAMCARTIEVYEELLFPDAAAGSDVLVAASA